VPVRSLLTLTDLSALTGEIVECRACPRLVRWREDVAREKRAAYRDEEYWGRPVPGFGDPRARMAIVGLAPAAHGGNRTGRVFTGDRSGDFLFASMYRTGFANQAESTRAGDGLRLRDAYVAAAVRCAPPANKPTPRERDTCMPYLVRELQLLPRVRVIVVLGAFGYEATWSTLRAAALPGVELPARRPRFAHGAEVPCGALTIVGAFHPSQQNTFTGRLTPQMLDDVFVRAGHLINATASPIP
jgi:uracil-DNA glycosylase family 4